MKKESFISLFLAEDLIEQGFDLNGFKKYKHLDSPKDWILTTDVEKILTVEDWRELTSNIVTFVIESHEVNLSSPMLCLFKAEKNHAMKILSFSEAEANIVASNKVCRLKNLCNDKSILRR
jgi:hypothetical protein